ncbi:helix-turn-helix domain-containing protein [Pseudobutyrivibrio sp.]|uniref:helix-turn-helix domain-containing protein n=1 Tax=Pseudobutyrivibrio sp. TaxID=2014367 RepID=UPI00386FE411
MLHSYNQIYLNDAMTNLAEAFETAASIYKFDLDYFMHLFIASGIAQQFQVGNPKYISGKSGAELVADIVLKTNACEINLTQPIFINPSIEYWTGWVLAYFQWYTGMSFKDIQKVISMSELMDKYHPYHEMDEQKIVDLIITKYKESDTVNRLQAYRRALGLSQSQLSKEAEINLRTLQQYEIGAKDISKASVSTVISLSKVLNCSVEELIGVRD